MLPQLEKKLSESDNALFKSGACHVFADEILKFYSAAGFMFRRLADNNLENERGQSLHVYIAKENQMVDVDGLADEDAFIENLLMERISKGSRTPNFKSIPTTRDELFSALRRDDDEVRGLRNQWHLALDPDFVEQCRIRAQSYILSNRGIFPT